MPKLKPGHISPTPEENALINAQIAADSDDRELAGDYWADAKPASEFFDKKTFEGLVALQHRKGRPKAVETKVPVTLRLAPDVAEYWRATGKGWQTRLQKVIEQYAADHPLPH